MKIFRNKIELDNHLGEIRKKGQEIGLIPTMGSIHKGHKSLVEKCIEANFFSLATIYVNPTQFNNKDDFDNYPRNEEKDISELAKIHCDALFLPLKEDMYPNGLKRQREIFDYRDILCDKLRPGHFDGVTTVVKALFDLTQPDHAYFGEKDFQQLKLIEKLVQQNDLPIVIHASPSIRLENGISYSSRFKNFSIEEKKTLDKAAKFIYEHLIGLKKNVTSLILNKLKKNLLEVGVSQIDYLEVRNEKELSFPSLYEKSRLFVAFYIGNIRVIDNFSLN
jgi:pantoate--beta-alanine ligase